MDFKRVIRSAIVLGVMVILGALTAQAQEFRGTISGAVTDPTGAAIPGASVVVTETHTGTVNRTKSDADGQYVVPFLLPGDYKIVATMPGFATTTQSNVAVESQAHPIVNMHLQVGQETQSVTVSTAPPLIDQANASVGQVISTESVENLPLNGRTPTTFTELSEGVITTAAPQIIHPFDNNAGNSWSIGGTPNQNSEVLLDGSPDLTLLGALAYAPTQDSVQEVSVRPFDTDASFGHTIGGVVNQITRSGTNHVHGTLYEFYQTAGLDANLYFNKRANQSRPNAHFHQYGATVGGPIFVPKVYDGKDKAFFFLAFEGLRDSTPNNQLLTVPTAAERTGDFSQLLNTCANGFASNTPTAGAVCNPDSTHTQAYADPYQLYNPFTATLNAKGQVVRTPIYNNQLNTAGPLNPVAAKYFSLYPQANATGSSTGQNNYSSTAPSVDTYDNEFGRLDFNVSSRDHIFGDFRHNYREQVKNNFFGNNATGTTLVRENYGLTIDNVFTLNPTTILDTRVNWTLFNEVHGAPSQAYSGATVGLGSLDSTSQEVQLPCINFSTSTSTFSCGTNTTSYATLGDNTSSFNPTTNYQVFADIVKVLGRHTLKVGFDGRQYRISIKNFANTEGTFNFGTNYVGSGAGNPNFAGTTPAFGGDLASFYFGLPTAGDLDNNTRADYHTYYIGAFVQDDWRISDKFTLNLGVRYDIDTPYREKYGRTESGFNPTAVNSASAAAAAAFKSPTVTANGISYNIPSINTLGGLTYPSSNGGAPWNTNNGFVSPRIGFNYSPTPKDTIRGGFGIFVQPETLASLNAQGTFSSSFLNNQEGFSASTPFVASTNGYQTPTGTLSNPFPNGIAQPTGSSLGASTFLGQSISFFAPNEHDPYSERFDLGYQRSITNSTLLEVLYVGNHSLHLPVATQNLNAVQAQYLAYTPYRDQSLATAYATNGIANPFAGQLPGNATFNGATTSYSYLLGRYPQFGNNAVNIQNQTIGQSYFHEAIVHVEQRSRHGLTLTANYSFSKLTEADTFLNDQDATLTHRISPFDHTHHFTVGSTYELPFGKGKLVSFGGSTLMNEIFGGFVVNAIYQFQTGAPIEFSADVPLQPGVTLRSITSQHRNTAPVPTTADPNANVGLNRSQYVLGSVTTCPTTGACDGSVFINGQYSNHERTLPQTLSWVRQDGFNNLDASLLKNFNFTSSKYLQLRFEAFNVANHAVFAAPNVSSPTATNFGYITAVFANSQPRQVQLGARFVF